MTDNEATRGTSLTVQHFITPISPAFHQLIDYFELFTIYQHIQIKKPNI
jgi:hypothetical protein